MLCRCGHALDHIDERTGVRKVRTPMVLITPGDPPTLAVVCPSCKAEVPVQIGGERRLVVGRMPVLHIPHVRSLTMPVKRA